MEKFAPIDYIIFCIYFVLVSGYGYWIYKSKKAKEGEVSDSKDFFLAEGSLTWWAIGASLIASNISAEQFIGMSGNGFTVGVAVAAYEWIAALALIIVAVWFIPVYLKNKIFTMPQFLETRYNQTTSLIMAIFWLFLYVFVNLTSILYLGAIAISAMAGPEYFHAIVIAMAIFSLVITLGGMKVIGFTDVIQVVVLVVGGLATTYIALTMVSEHFGLGTDALAGFKKMMEVAPDHFKLMVDKPATDAPQADINKYLMLPGIAMYFAGIWIVNLNYWGCNQYITQRALGADLKTARTGILFAGFMKLAMPIIVMLPGIAAYVLYSNGALQNEMGIGADLKPDNAYSAILGFLPTGLKGLSVAALTAAIVASLAGKANSISTIFTLDIYQRYINKTAGEKKLVNMGRIAILVAILFSVALTWNDALGIGGEGGFTFIQKYTGFFSPGVFAVFFLGMFWKRTTGAAAVAGVVVGFLLSVFFNSFAVEMFGNETLLWTAYKNASGVYEIPFLICMGWAFVFTLLLMIGMSLAGPKVNPKAFGIDTAMFKVAPSTLALIVVTLLCLAGLYVTFW
ncbi:sodium transporter [Flavobacterium akiainvivens]|uniref:Sodium transporter n=1 Tax=Flavobacterium akiainvivens TaxID=1202724 RepID=A0A0M8MH24_9FLAO|nr:sodium/solute symporter [Flavobacterium akiainvivens]KOS06081.1 sodium transporter [Flavobacterium akiainvivens]SFQ54800.1 solute:Na+ symporter, SSS family [Flavobacterium akiainvivens]